MYLSAAEDRKYQLCLTADENCCHTLNSYCNSDTSHYIIFDVFGIKCPIRVSKVANFSTAELGGLYQVTTIKGLDLGFLISRHKFSRLFILRLVRTKIVNWGLDIKINTPTNGRDARSSIWFHPQLWLVHLNQVTLCVAAFGARSVTSISGKPKRRTLSQIFRSSRVFRPPKHMYVDWNLLGFIELLLLLRFGTFPLEERAICGVTSGQRSME